MWQLVMWVINLRIHCVGHLGRCHFFCAPHPNNPWMFRKERTLVGGPRPPVSFSRCPSSSVFVECGRCTVHAVVNSSRHESQTVKPLFSTADSATSDVIDCYKNKNLYNVKICLFQNKNNNEVKVDFIFIEAACNAAKKPRLFSNLSSHEFNLRNVGGTPSIYGDNFCRTVLVLYFYIFTLSAPNVRVILLLNIIIHQKHNKTNMKRLFKSQDRNKYLQLKLIGNISTPSCVCPSTIFHLILWMYFLYMFVCNILFLFLIYINLSAKTPKMAVKRGHKFKSEIVRPIIDFEVCFKFLIKR